MYEVIRTIIDDFLMGPGLAPFTTLGLIVLIVMGVSSILADARNEDES